MKRLIYFGIVLVIGITLSVSINREAKAYYADKTAHYESEAAANALEVQVILMERSHIGTPASVQK